MAIPDYQTIMLPFLKFAADKKEHSKQETVSYLARYFNLTEAELKVMLYSGKQELFDNRVGWARTYLKKAGLIDSIRWGYYHITERGLALLKTNPSKIDVDLLHQYSEFNDFVETKDSKADIQNETPQETISKAARRIDAALVKDILNQLKTNPNVSPTRFENIVVELMVAIGYGSNIEDGVQALGKIGDGGVDGVILQDALGINKVYLQAKKYTDKQVGGPEIRDFMGALEIRRASFGVFITTSTFTKDAITSAASSTRSIILIDGERLASLMIAHDVGVTVEETIKLKKLDMDYFIEE